WVEPRLVFTGEGAQLPNDPLLSSQWAWENVGQDFGAGPGLVGFDMDIDAAAGLTRGEASVGVLVIDTGIDPSHPDLTWSLGIDLAVVGGPAVAGAPQNVCDDHGTWVAGVTSALRDNAEGIAGMVPECTLISGKPFESNVPCNGSWSTTSGNTALALDFAAQNGVRVTNNSNAYGFTSQALEDKYTELEGQGVVHFAAAGNSSNFGIAYPATLPQVIAVGASSELGEPTGFTSIGPQVEFTAPGQNVWTTDRAGADGGDVGDYAAVNGTSFASPHLAGLAAMLLSVNPSLDTSDVRRIFRASTRDLRPFGIDGTSGFDVLTGFGQPDAFVALEIANGSRAGLALDGRTLDTWLGGSATLEVLTYPPAALGTYRWVLGSTGGMGPGPMVGREFLPLTADDPYFVWTSTHENEEPLLNNFGPLDPMGKAAATLVVPAAEVLPVPYEVYHSVLTFDPLLGILPERGLSVPRSVRLENVTKLESGPIDLVIPDVGPTLSQTFGVSGIGSSLSEIELRTDIRHGYAGDLEIALTSPAGTRVVVWASDPFASFANLYGLWGTYFAPAESFSAFIGEDPNGTWTLEVTDLLLFEEGILEQWGLYLTSN
ncbi:MAG: S8 family serine peptidase, partial [Planctomycetota bacterium]